MGVFDFDVEKECVVIEIEDVEVVMMLYCVYLVGVMIVFCLGVIN